MRAEARRLRPQAPILVLLVLWAFGPLVATLAWVASHGGAFTGVNGQDLFDQFQYLAWIRDTGEHLLASNLWVIGHTPHDYLQPMYLVSGLLWWLGASVQVAYLVWKPVAVLILFFGVAAYARHLLGDRRGPVAAALLVALFYQSPVYAVAIWTGRLTAAHRLDLILASDDANPSVSLWGFDHTAIAIGLAPLFLIAAEKLLAGAGAGAGAQGRGSARRWTAVAAVSGLMASWLYPWLGGTVLAIVGAMFLFRGPRRRYLALAVPVAATVLPLIYSFVLSHSDASWRAFQTRSTATGTAPWWALIASFGPLVALAALGLRRPRNDRDWMLTLWPVACAAVYFLVPEFPSHALAGVTIPLAILAVRGWARVAAWTRARSPGLGLAAAAVAVLGALAVTIPAAVQNVRDARDQLRPTIAGRISQSEFNLTTDQAQAFAYLDHASRPGGVLAPFLLSMSIPAFTDRQTYAGHPQWQPPSNLALDDEFFDPSLNDPGGVRRRAILKVTKATFVIVDCGAPPELAKAIAPVTRPVRRFGCLTVYATR